MMVNSTPKAILHELFFTHTKLSGYSRMSFIKKIIEWTNFAYLRNCYYDIYFSSRHLVNKTFVSNAKPEKNIVAITFLYWKAVHITYKIQ